MQSANRAGPKPPVHRAIVRDACREIRARFRASRKGVDPYLDDFVGGRRGVKAADQLNLLADTMLSGGYSPAEASEALAKMSNRIVTARAQQRAG
jgi:hypothetical protein